MSVLINNNKSPFIFCIFKPLVRQPPYDGGLHTLSSPTTLPLVVGNTFRQLLLRHLCIPFWDIKIPFERIQPHISSLCDFLVKCFAVAYFWGVLCASFIQLCIYMFICVFVRMTVCVSMGLQTHMLVSVHVVLFANFNFNLTYAKFSLIIQLQKQWRVILYT